MRKYLTKKAYVRQEEFYSLELNGELVERVKNRIKKYNDFSVSDEEIELIDENVLASCFTNTRTNGIYDALTDAQKLLLNKRDNGDYYDFENYIEEILNELVWDCECEYGDSEVEYCDDYIETY